MNLERAALSVSPLFLGQSFMRLKPAVATHAHMAVASNGDANTHTYPDIAAAASQHQAAKTEQ